MHVELEMFFVLVPRLDDLDRVESHKVIHASKYPLLQFEKRQIGKRCDCCTKLNVQENFLFIVNTQ